MKTFSRCFVCAIAVVSLLALASCLPPARTKPLAQENAMTLKPGDPVDIAPWGERTISSDGKDVGIFWEDARDVCRVEVVFAAAAPQPESVRLQWWQSQWPERRIPRNELSGAGGSGWLNIGDWYQGRWLDADAILNTNGNTWTYTFRPLNAREFAALKDFPAEYRTTLKLRLLFEQVAPRIEAIRVFSDSKWKSTDVTVEWERPAGDSRLEVFNGYGDSATAASARIWFTESPNVNSFDRTIVTVRAGKLSFSFDAAELAAGGRVFSPFYRALVRRSDDKTSYAAELTRRKARKAKPIYERVFDEPEQTFARAWAEMPPKGRFYIPLGLEGGRERFGVNPDGSVFCRNDRLAGKSNPRRVWGGEHLDYSFGLPAEPARRWLEDNNLPIIHAQWERGGIRYTQTAFVTRLGPGSLGWPEVQANDTAVLMMRIACENTTPQPAAASLDMAIRADDRPLELSARDGLIYAKVADTEALRAAIGWPGQLTANPNGIALRQDLPANGSCALSLKIPFITLGRPSELDRLKAMTFDDELKRVRGFWTSRADASCQITTPVEQVSNFYRAHVSHLLINCEREVGSDRYMARVGSFSYGVFGNESCMMITDLDRRGLHAEAERCLDAFLHYQGTAKLPGDYATQDGIFYGAGGYECGGYNQHHGWILWAMAEHYRYTGDEAWLKRNADKLLKGCRWISNERARTKRFGPRSLRGIEHGLLLPGSLEDIGDWRCWLSNNNFSWWGMDAVARVLADIGHPEAKALRAEADAYRADILAAFREAMVRAPLVRLSDGSYIPQIPSEVHRRGRTFGWITVTLEGPIYLIRTGLLDPRDPLAECIMQDYEDNLYLSEQYGYSAKEAGEYWFSRGGFSMQPNLLCSPHPYLMRDEIGHFLRSYFNAFAVCYYPDTQMMTEHPLPGMGDWRGDHYKSSDESNSTYWLRLMFIDERGVDLYLGMAVPRAWLADGCKPAIERAASYFGPLSLRFESHATTGTITATIDPPTRRAPAKLFLRIRHPQEKKITRVTINGKRWSRFDPAKELIELPRLTAQTTVVAHYEK